MDIFKFKTQNFYKLSTHEDIYNTHKIFGILSLLHFIIRIYLWIYTGNMQFNKNILTPICMIPHIFLPLSSLVFYLPTKRNLSVPTMYPEFRLHSIIFALRSIVIVLMMWLDYPLYYREIVLILTMIIADISTNIKNQNNLTTTRDMPNNLELKNIIRYFYGISQVIGSMQCIYSTKIDQVFIILIPIQLGAFFKTLAKKGIMSTNSVNFYYILTLISNYLYARTNNLPETGVISGYIKHPLTILFCILRFRYNINKYLLWILVIIYNEYSNYK